MPVAVAVAPAVAVAVVAVVLMVAADIYIYIYIYIYVYIYGAFSFVAVRGFHCQIRAHKFSSRAARAQQGARHPAIDWAGLVQWS